MPPSSKRRRVISTSLLEQTQSPNEGSLTVVYGANQSQKVFTLRRSISPRQGKESKIAKIGRSIVVREPRSYADDKMNQTLRHTASTVKYLLDKNRVRGYQEVQVGINKKTGAIYISTNTNRTNDKLRSILSREKREQVIKLLSTVRESLMPIDSKGVYNRTARHIKKFLGRVPPQMSDRWLEIPIIIPERVDSSLDGFHAERRIKRAMGISGFLPDNVQIKGLRRPCAHCFTEMKRMEERETINGQGSGPMWTSRAASLGGIEPIPWITRISRDRNNTLRDDCNTDSDSDAD